MPSNKPQIKVEVTKAQQQAIKDATTASGLKPADARRLAYQLLCEKFGITFPNDMPEHGGKRKK